MPALDSFDAHQLKPRQADVEFSWDISERKVVGILWWAETCCTVSSNFFHKDSSWRACCSLSMHDEIRWVDMARSDAFDCRMRDTGPVTWNILFNTCRERITSNSFILTKRPRAADTVVGSSLSSLSCSSAVKTVLKHSNRVEHPSSILLHDCVVSDTVSVLFYNIPGFAVLLELRVVYDCRRMCTTLEKFQSYSWLLHSM